VSIKINRSNAPVSLPSSSTSFISGSSSRLGEFVHAKSGKLVSEGYLPVNPGTITNGATDYPIWASMYPEYVSGNDIVFPTNVEGIFLRNLGGNAANEGDFQEDQQARNPQNPVSTTVNSGSGNTVRNITSREETRPDNRAYQLYTIVDTYHEILPTINPSLAVTPLDASLILLDSGSTNIQYNVNNPGTGVVSVLDGELDRSGHFTTAYFQMRFDEDDIFVLNLSGIVAPASTIVSVQVTAKSGNGTHEPYSDINCSVTGAMGLYFNRSNNIDSDVIWNLKVEIREP